MLSFLSLLANFVGWDVQAIRKEAKEEVQAARKKAKEEAKKEAQKAVQETREKDIEKLLNVFESLNISRDMARQQLMKEYELSEAEADKKLELYY